MSRAQTHHPPTTSAPSRLVLRAAWAVAPRVLAQRLDTQTPKRASIVLTLDAGRDKISAAAHLDDDEHPIELPSRTRLRVLASDRALHVVAPGVIELTALTSADEPGRYEPVYARAPFLDALDLPPAAADGPTLELS